MNRRIDTLEDQASSHRKELPQQNFKKNTSTSSSADELIVGVRDKVTKYILSKTDKEIDILQSTSSELNTAGSSSTTCNSDCYNQMPSALTVPVETCHTQISNNPMANINHQNVNNLSNSNYGVNIPSTTSQISNSRNQFQHRQQSQTIRSQVPSNGTVKRTNQSAHQSSQYNRNGNVNSFAGRPLYYNNTGVTTNEHFLHRMSLHSHMR